MNQNVVDITVEVWNYYTQTQYLIFSFVLYIFSLEVEWIVDLVTDKWINKSTITIHF